MTGASVNGLLTTPSDLGLNLLIRKVPKTLSNGNIEESHNDPLKTILIKDHLDNDDKNLLNQYKLHLCYKMSCVPGTEA